MIQTDVPQRLGRKAFFLLFGRRAAIAILFIIVSLVLLAVSGSIIKGLAIALSSGQSTATTVGPISSFISFIVSGCFLIGIFLFLIGFVISWLEYRNFTFDFGEFDLHLSRGIIDKRETSIPYRQIQDVNIERNFDHQLMGMAKIVMTTAGHEESGETGMSEIALDPLDKDVATEIRALLERKIGVQVVVDQSVADKQAQAANPAAPVTEQHVQ